MSRLQFSVAQPGQFPKCGRFFADLLSQARTAEIRGVATEAVPWETLWQYIQSRTISQSGLDVSEVGNSWIASLADSDILRPFSNAEIAGLGGSRIFSESAWQSAGVSFEGALSIPWMTDTRVIYYWQDMFFDAGINGAKAFRTVEETTRSLAQLHKAGIPAWGAPTFPCNNTVHHVASWLWARGEDFVSRDMSKIMLVERNALSALKEYFMLYRFMPHAFDSFEALLSAFKSKRVACVMDGPWLLSGLMKSAEGQAPLKQLRVALPPGAPFLGGSNLVVWKYIEEKKIPNALALVAELLSAPIQTAICQPTGRLPVLQKLLDKAPFSTDMNYKMIIEAERQGRHLPAIPLWSHIENSLLQAFGHVWQRIKENAAVDIEGVLEKQLTSLSRRFDHLLSIF